MKTFEDLEFKTTQNLMPWPVQVANLELDNGYSIKVITGTQPFTCPSFQYTLGIMKDGEPTSDNPTGKAMLPLISELDVRIIMKSLQEPKK